MKIVPKAEKLKLMSDMELKNTIKGNIDKARNVSTNLGTAAGFGTTERELMLEK